MEDEINQLVGRIIGSTKRRTRSLSIVEVAADIRTLKEKAGGLGQGAKLVGISTGMLNQFLSVFSLPLPVQGLVREKKIDSVAVVFALSKFPAADIDQLTGPIMENKISSQELKVLLPLRRQQPSEPILDLVKRMKSSQNVKVSILRLPKELQVDRDLLLEAIKGLVGDENVLSVDEQEETVDIALTKEGERRMRAAARDKKLTLAQFVHKLLEYAR
jgi:hypothetical protein